MDKNHPIVEPNFEGEEMKLPSVSTPQIASAASRNLLSGPIIVLLFLILIAILGGFYYWYTLVMREANFIEIPTRPTIDANNEPESVTAEARTELMDVVSTSDELGAIAADVESTNLGDLDNEIPAIEAELNAALTSPTTSATPQ